MATSTLERGESKVECRSKPFLHHLPLSTFGLMSPLDLFDFHPRFFQHLLGQGIGIPLFVDDPLNPSIDDHLRTDDAGMIRTVEGGSPNLDSVIGGLDDRILFRVEPAAEFMSFSGGDAEFYSKATNVQTMFQS